MLRVCVCKLSQLWHSSISFSLKTYQSRVPSSFFFSSSYTNKLFPSSVFLLPSQLEAWQAPKPEPEWERERGLILVLVLALELGDLSVAQVSSVTSAAQYAALNDVEQWTEINIVITARCHHHIQICFNLLLYCKAELCHKTQWLQRERERERGGTHTHTNTHTHTQTHTMCPSHPHPQ